MNKLLEVNPSDNELIGRNPKSVEQKDLIEAGHKAMPLSKVIRQKCLDCCCYDQSEVRKCVSTDCPLWCYRLGKNPFSNRKGNPEALKKAREIK